MASLLRAVIYCVVVCSLFVASDARAAAYHVQARTEAQAYQLRAYRGTTADDTVLLPRRRIVQYLGLDAFELVTGQDLGFESNLRVYSDFGLARGESELVDGLRTEDVDLMYANVRYRTGGFEGKLGRQYFIDTTEMFAFDGVRARYLHKLGVGAEAYAGLWVKGASLLGSSTYQLDGIRELEQRPSARQLEYDPFLEEQSGLEPVVGVRALAQNVNGTGLSGSVGYRFSTLLGGKTTSQRLGLSFDYGEGKGINLMSALDYDLFIGRVASFRTQARYDAELFAASVEALRFAPTFSSYSIWYYFATAPRDELRLRGDFTPVGPLRYYATVLVNRYNTELPDTLGISSVVANGEAPTDLVFGAGGGAQFTTRTIRSGADLTWRNGWGGRQLWVDVNGGYVGGDGRWSVDGRFSFASVRDQYNSLLRGNFYGLQLWGSYQLTPAARASLVVEENVNPFTRSDTKVFFVFDLKAML